MDFDENLIKRTARRYGVFVVRHPVVTLSIAIIIIIAAVVGATMIKSANTNNRDMIPDGVPVVEVFNLVEEKFPGGTESMRVAIELNSRSSQYNVSDIRDPAILRYDDVLAQRLALIEDVTSVSTITQDLKALNGGNIPGSLESVKSIIDKNLESEESSYISPDYDIIVISLGLTDNPDSHELYDEIIQATNEVKSGKPPYVDSYPVGSIVRSVEISKVMVKDMTTTTMVSVVFIFFIMMSMFFTLRSGRSLLAKGFFGIIKSFVYTISALLAVVVGLLWAFGLAGALGLPLTEIVSGAASMIVGIGIDFGIQTVSRFRQEFIANGRSLEVAMGMTLSGIFVPLVTTTAVGVIGFMSMSAGQLTIMRDLGTMMIYGIISCLFAALLVVPTALALVERFRLRLNKNNQ